MGIKLEDAIGFSKKYDVKNIYDIMVKGREVTAYLQRNYPVMPVDWYTTETYRRVKILCKTGYFNRDLSWDSPEQHKG